jgi:hypothetical protein
MWTTPAGDLWWGTTPRPARGADWPRSSPSAVILWAWDRRMTDGRLSEEPQRLGCGGGPQRTAEAPGRGTPRPARQRRAAARRRVVALSAGLRHPRRAAAQTLSPTPAPPARPQCPDPRADPPRPIHATRHPPPRIGPSGTCASGRGPPALPRDAGPGRRWRPRHRVIGPPRDAPARSAWPPAPWGCAPNQGSEPCAGRGPQARPSWYPWRLERRRCSPRMPPRLP